MAWILGAQIVLSIIYMILIFTESTADFVKDCQSQFNGTESESWCQDQIGKMKGITVAGVVIDLLLTACKFLSTLLHYHRSSSSSFRGGLGCRSIRIGTSAEGDESQHHLRQDKLYQQIRTCR